MRALTGKARKVVTDMTPEDIAAVTESDGHKQCVEHIKDRLGEPPVGEVANPMDQHLTHHKREKNESMGACLARGERLVHKLLAALGRTMGTGPAGSAGTTPGAAATPTPSTSRRDCLPRLGPRLDGPLEVLADHDRAGGP